MIKLAIFDLDGTLFDTGEVNYYAYRDAFSRYGVNLEHDYFVSECNGKHYKSFGPHFLKDAVELEDVHKIKKTLYKEYIGQARMNDSLFEIMRLLKNNSVKIALVTTASRTNTFDLLNYFSVSDMFDLIITQEDVDSPKPDPEGFVKAFNFFSVKESDALIFEDSDSGVEAAKRTGAGVIRVEQF